MGIIFTIDYFERGNGSVPAIDALNQFQTVSVELKDAVLAGVERLEDYANHTGSLTEYVSSDLWCMRIRFNRNCARLFFTFAPGARLFLLNGYVKKTDKIPPQELRRAQRLVREFKIGGMIC